jgi:hemerythrin
MATFIDWKEFYSVGHPNIDLQHREILDIINDLYGAMAFNKENMVLGDLLERLVAYTMNHFTLEEKIMEEHGFPRLAEHKRLHYLMAQKTRKMRGDFDSLSGKALLNYLKDWWTNHILLEDKQYAPYLTQVLSRV